MKTVTATRPIQSAPSIETARPTEPRVHSTWQPGDVAHQGDLILVCVASRPKSAKPRENRQLADGDTKGSRHFAVGGKVYTADPAECAALVKAATGKEIAASYMGPCLSGAVEVVHPEHQHQHFPDHDCTVIVYQRNLDAEEREIRARD